MAENNAVVGVHNPHSAAEAIIKKTITPNKCRTGNRLMS
jgi:hypothetical protein